MEYLLCLLLHTDQYQFCHSIGFVWKVSRKGMKCCHCCMVMASVCHGGINSINPLMDRFRQGVFQKKLTNMKTWLESPDFIIMLIFLSMIQWNLICGKANFSYLSQSAFFVGALLGAWIWGTMSDKFGRRKVFFITSFLMILSGLGTSLSFNYYSFVFFRVCLASSFSGCLLSSYVLCIELVGKSRRNLAGVFCAIVFGLSYLLLAVLAYFIRNWRVLSFLLSASNVLVFALVM